MNARQSVAAALLVVVLSWTAAGNVHAGEATRLEATASTSAAGPGDTAVVRGKGWPQSALVQVQLCGNNALDGTSDCDNRGAATSSTSPEGEFGTRIVVSTPPTPCPCVIYVTSPNLDDSVRIPFEVLGAPVGLGEPQPTRGSASGEVEVRQAAVIDEGPGAAWFGAASERRLHLEIYNGTDQDVALQGSAVWGKGDDASNVVALGDLPTLVPGETVILERRFELEALAFGRYTVRGEIGGFAQKVEFEAGMTSYPWVLLIAPLLIVAQVLLLGLRNRVRKRLHEGGPDEPGAVRTATGPQESSGPDAEAPVTSPTDESDEVSVSLTTALPVGPWIAGPIALGPAMVRAVDQRAAGDHHDDHLAGALEDDDDELTAQIQRFLDVRP